ncbi:MAG: M56 family metallopeptidase [Fimbriimonas sp.]|nr:M56 family metallopeptidase [Fimbriimonas sp.]
MIAILIWSLRTIAVAALSVTSLALMRSRSAAQRNLVLRIAIAVAWLLPVMAMVAPRIELPSTDLVRAFPSARAMPPVVDSPKTKPFPAQRPARSIAYPTTDLSKSPAPVTFPWSLVYGIGVGLILLRWTLGMAGLARIRRSAAPTGDPDVWRAAVLVPATYGGTILVPECSVDWPAGRLQAAILHERAHIRRRDWLWQSFAGGLATVQWFNPFAWLLIRIMRDTAEAAADDAVLADGLTPSEYARELLAVAASAAPVGPALAMARRGGVKDRVVAILAATQDRRTPSRHTTVILATLLFVSGIAVAGLAGKEELLTGSSVRLADVRQLSPFPSSRWNAEGLGVFTPDEVAGDSQVAASGFTPLGKKRMSVRFAVDHFTESDKLRIWVEKPAAVVVYGSPHGNGQPSEGRNDGALGLTLEAPLQAARAQVRVGRATGPYHAFAGKVPFTATSEPITWPEGTFAGAKIDFRFPAALADVDYRVFVLTDKGRVEVRDNEYEYTDDENEVPKTVYIAVDNPAHVRSVGIETRAYRITSFDLRLAPKGPLNAPKLVESKHSIELIRLSEGDRAWLPDGTPAKAVGKMTSFMPANAGYKKLTLAFRVHGKTWFQPTLAPNIGEAYALDGDRSGFLATPDKPDERIGIVTLNVLQTTRVSPITVVLRTSSWQNHADQLVGPGAGHAHLTRLKQEVGADGDVWTTYRVVLDGVPPISPGRDIQLTPLNGNSQGLGSIVERRATPKDPSYTLIVRGKDPVRRLILQSQAIEQARFDNVHLTPNP